MAGVDGFGVEGFGVEGLDGVEGLGVEGNEVALAGVLLSAGTFIMVASTG